MSVQQPQPQPPTSSEPRTYFVTDWEMQVLMTSLVTELENQVSYWVQCELHPADVDLNNEGAFGTGYWGDRIEVYNTFVKENPKFASEYLQKNLIPAMKRIADYSFKIALERGGES